MKAKTASKPTTPIDSIVLDSPVSLRVTCRRKIRNNRPPKATDNPEDMYDECGGTYEAPAAEFASSTSQIFRCQKCDGEFDNGMRRLGGFAAAINNAVRQATSNNPMYSVQISKIITKE